MIIVPFVVASAIVGFTPIVEWFVDLLRATGVRQKRSVPRTGPLGRPTSCSIRPRGGYAGCLRRGSIPCIQRCVYRGCSLDHDRRGRCAGEHRGGIHRICDRHLGGLRMWATARQASRFSLMIPIDWEVSPQPLLKAPRSPSNAKGHLALSRRMYRCLSQTLQERLEQATLLAGRKIAPPQVEQARRIPRTDAGSIASDDESVVLEGSATRARSRSTRSRSSTCASLCISAVGSAVKAVRG